MPTPQFKVYSADGEYLAAVKQPEQGAAILAMSDSMGATIRYGHQKKSIVWTDGSDGWASESYDVVAETGWKRVEAWMADWRKKASDAVS